MPIASDDITGLVLAGGRGSRLGGVDKGLLQHRGEPLAMHALRRLQPQVACTMISANRNRAAYAAMGVPVWPDAAADHPGPLAGLLAGLEHCRTGLLATVPCDCPDFPTDLVARLAAALQAERAEIAVAATVEAGVLRRQPVFCLLQATLRDSLAGFLQGPDRQVARWLSQHRLATVVFDDAAAFFNTNTPEDLQRLQQRQR